MSLALFTVTAATLIATTGGDVPEPRDPTLAVVETLGFLGFGATWYFVDYTTNAHDWDFPFEAETFAKKLSLEYARFENNNFYHNAFGHAVAGTFYYNAWRANGYSSFESFIAGVVVSAIWEFFFEWREVASINDMIVSAFGGVALGEAMHQNARVLLSQPQSFTRSFLAAAMDPPLFFRRYFSDAKIGVPYRMMLSSTFGLSAFSGDGGTRALASFGVESAVFDDIAHGVGEPETKWMFDTPYTEFTGSFALGEERGAVDSRFRATHVVLGYLAQSYVDSETTPDGYTFFAGLATAFDHATRRLPDRSDRYGAVDLAGPFVSLEAQFGRTRLWAQGQAYVDFAVMSAFALDEYARNHDISNTKTSIRDRGYYYGFGGSVGLSAGITVDPFELSLSGRILAVDSIEGRDRFQEAVSNDFSLFDRRDTYGARLAWDVIDGVVRFFIAAEVVRFDGRIGDVVLVETQRRFDTGVGLLL